MKFQHATRLQCGFYKVSSIEMKNWALKEGNLFKRKNLNKLPLVESENISQKKIWEKDRLGVRNMATLKGLMLIDQSGVLIANYPDINENEMSVFSGVIMSLASLSEQMNIGPLRSLEIGENRYMIKKINGSLLIAIFDRQAEHIEWFTEVLANALRATLNFVREEEGLIKKHEYSAFKNVLMKFYNEFERVHSKYIELAETYVKAKENMGPKALDLLNRILTPNADVKENGKGLELIDVTISDIDQLYDIIDFSLRELKYNARKSTD